MVRTFAAIDVGSFELEIGIYEMSGKSGFREIDHVRHVIALGRDTFNEGKISYELVEELCQVLTDFARLMKTYQVEDYRAYGTSAMREAKNSQIVLDQVRVRTGFDIKVISNSEQRFISYKAIAAKDAEFQKTIQQSTAIVDVGYGSMQISLFDKDALVSTQNLPFGVLRMREMLSGIRVTGKARLNLMSEMVDNELIIFRKMYLKDRPISNLIGIGDAIRTLAYQMRSEMAEGQRKDRITLEEFSRFFDRIKSMTTEQLEEIFDVDHEYATMMLPTVVIYKRIMETTGAGVMWIPGIQMTDGIAAEYAESNKILKFNHKFDNDIIVTSRNMGKRYKCPMPHVQAVEKMALKIFDSVKKYHGLKSRERLLLQIAANLHSCGEFVTVRGASDCAYNIIMATEIIGLSHVERELVANVVRYQGQTFRYNEVEIEARPSRYTRLATPVNLIMIVAKLTAILQLADSMDRSHKAKLENSRITVKDNQLIITTEYEGDVTLENMSIQQRVDFFEEIFGIRPLLKQKKKV